MADDCKSTTPERHAAFGGFRINGCNAPRSLLVWACGGYARSGVPGELMWVDREGL